MSDNRAEKVKEFLRKLSMFLKGDNHIEIGARSGVNMFWGSRRKSKLINGRAIQQRRYLTNLHTNS